MNFLDQYTLWLEKTKDDKETQKELLQLKDDETKQKEVFYKELEFGTAGLRGILGVGTNRMNIYTVRKATQGFANYLNNAFTNPSLAISYDSRNKSALFAMEVAKVMAGNGIGVFLTDTLTPTPFLSYMVRNLNCCGGVMITASHNPFIYNGYKAYDQHGCQLTDAPAKSVTEEVEKVDIFTGVSLISQEEALEKGLLTMVSQELMAQYIQDVYERRMVSSSPVHDLKVVFTPLNGAGNLPVRMILEKIGCTHLSIVPQQEMPDGNFTTCPYPNPEEKEALALGLDLAKKTSADLLLATDPDSDRVGVALYEGEQFKILTGNEIGLLLLDFIIQQRKQCGTMPSDPIVMKTIVSSNLVDAICKTQQITCINLLTGFKYIGEQIQQLKEENQAYRFIFGYEESFGYLTDEFVRDKDAVLAAMHIVQMAQLYKQKGLSLLDKLKEIYDTYGYVLNCQKGYAFEGIQGMEEMKAIMKKLRTEKPDKLGEFPVRMIRDYFTKESVDLSSNKISPLSLPQADVLEFVLEEGSSVIIRPSGTEPKVKAYLTICGSSMEESLEKQDQLLEIANNLMKI